MATKYTDNTELQKAIGFQNTAMETAYPGENEDTYESMLDAVIERTAAYIDAMIGSRYDVSTVEDNAILKRICISIAKFDVYTQFARMDVPETVKTEKEAAVKQLEQIAQGKLELAADGAAFVEGAVESEFSSATQVFGTSL